MASAASAQLQEDQADPEAPDAQRHRRVLDSLIDIGAGIASLLQQEAEALVAATEPGIPRADALTRIAGAYNATARTIRRTAALAEKLSQPQTETAAPRIAARKRIIREVEDTIQRETEDFEAEALHAELAERLDDPDLEEEIGQRPVAGIIADICRDLGLSAMPGTHPWKRRTPKEVAELGARAARSPVPPPGGETDTAPLHQLCPNGITLAAISETQPDHRPRDG